MFDKSASLKKTLQWIAEAAAQKPDLIVFPELFIPGYPVGMNFGFCIGKRSEDGRKDWKRYYDASVVSGETEFQQLAKAAQETGAYISLGFSERDAVNGTLYNSNVIFEPDGSYKVHRKLKPTGSERVVWGDADKLSFKECVKKDSTLKSKPLHIFRYRQSVYGSFQPIRRQCFLKCFTAGHCLIFQSVLYRYCTYHTSTSRYCLIALSHFISSAYFRSRFRFRSFLCR